MKNLLEQIFEEIKEHEVIVTLPGEQGERALYLVILKKTTKMINDFKNTYGEAVTALHEKLFKKAYGEEDVLCDYGLFVDDELRYIFAFNCEFADINRDKKTVEFKSIDDILMEKIDASGSVKPSEPSFFPSFNPSPSGNKKYGLPNGTGRPNPEMTFRYAITEKGDGKKKKK